MRVEATVSALLIVGLVCVSCRHAGGSDYSRMSDDVAFDHLTGDQRKVLEQRGRPWFVLKGPLATTVWVFCAAGTMRYWVEFDGNGDVLDEGSRRPLEPRVCQDTAKRPPSQHALTASATTAAPSTGLSCGQVSRCADTCAAQCRSGARKIACLVACKSNCRARGCRSARSVFDSLTSCIRSRCPTNCAGGPSPECKHCAGTKCAAEDRACRKHRCGSGHGTSEKKETL